LPGGACGAGAAFVRRKGVSGFPYGVVYVVRAEEIVILAYAHDRRRPGYWEHRLSS
jgi:hypothetical protein